MVTYDIFKEVFMKQIGVSVPDELREKLEELAKKEERSISWIVREILQNYFKD